MGLVSELKRRNVLRMAAIYVVAAWLIMQVAEVIIGLANLPEWMGPAILALLAIGFPIALLFSWFYELTAEGISLEKDVAAAGSITHVIGRRMDFIVISLLCAGLILFAYDKWWIGPPPEKSIAVLAFENMSADPEQDYFSDGISEELLNLLTQIPELTVISRSSAFSFKGKDVGIPTIAEQLNVAHVLEGSVRRMGNRVRITAQLIEASSDSHLWSESYDRELTAQSVFAIQREIAEQIANTLDLLLADGDRNKLNQVPPQNLHAYEVYLLGKQSMAMRSRAALLKASEYFEKAISLDRQYAPAYVGLADANLLLSNYGYVPLTQALAKAEPALSAALSLDESAEEVFASIGLSLRLQGDIQGAENAFVRSVGLNPNHATSLHWYGDLLVNSLGRPEAAIPFLERARRLDPLSPVITVTLGEAFSGIGNITDAIVFYRKAAEIQPDFPYSYSLLGRAYLALGDDAKAEYWINRLVALYPTELVTLSAKILLHRYRGERDEALRVARGMTSVAPRNNTSLFTLVTYGQHQEAIETIAPSFPELSCNVEPTITLNNMSQAMNLSLAFQETGERDCAERMLDEILYRMHEIPEQGYRSYGFLDAEVYARQGKTQQALDALRASLKKGMRISWWTQVEKGPHMTSLLDHPELKSMIADIRMDMATQLAHVRKMEASGDLAPAGE